MAKTMRNIVLVGIALILVAAGLSAAVMMGGCNASPAGSFEEARAGAINAVMDATGVKSQLDEEIRARAKEAVAQYGMPQTLADEIVDTLAIEDWEATALPENATETSNFTVDVQGNAIEVTTYDDESVVTLGALGQNVTFAVPESAQPYMHYVPYLAYLE